MNEVSREFKQAVYAPIRKTAAKVAFEILDNSAYDDADIEAEGAEISKSIQMIDKVRAMSDKFATFEKDYFKLDGSFVIPPTSNEEAANTHQLGWWSRELCSADGVFATPPKVTFTFSEPHDSMGLTLHFDSLNNEHASDFDIIVYSAGDRMIAREGVKDNKKNTYVWVTGLDAYEKIEIIITKWATPFRRARIVELDFGVLQEYEGDKLIKVSLIEQMNVVGDTLPANEVKFTIDNSNKNFNILNPVGFYRFLKERQELSISLGVDTGDDDFEFISTEGYYLTDWQSDEGALTTSFTARNVFELLDKDYIPKAADNLYDLAVDLMVKAKLTKYEIDETLKDIPTEGFKEKQTFRKALQCIGLASKSAVYQNRSGVITVKPFEILDQDTSYIYFAGPEMITGMVSPTVYSGYDMLNITFDNVFKEPQIKLDKLLQSITMTIHTGGTKEEHIFYNAENSEGVNFKCDNPLINTIERAQEVAQWVIDESNLRALYQVNWRQNPALECGDIVLIEDSFGAEKQSRITKQEYNFSGYLSGRTDTKGGV